MYSTQNNFKKNIKTSKEETKIFELVCLISSLEKRISDLNKTMEYNKNNELFQKISAIDEEILKRKKAINNYNENIKKEEINNNKISSYNELNNQIIEMDLEELNQKIKDITSDGGNNLQEIYTISNEKINTILSQKQTEDELKFLNIDYNIMNFIYQNILNEIKEQTNKIDQLHEKMRMLKEEKLTLNEKLAEHISKKESFEEMAKVYLYKFFNDLDKSENKILNNNLDILSNINIPEESLMLNLYELYNININELCKEIAYRIVEAINDYMKNNNIDTNLLENITVKENENDSIMLIYSKIKKDILLFINSFQSNNEQDKYINNFQILLNEFFINLSKNIIILIEFYNNKRISPNNEYSNLFSSNPNLSHLVVYIKLMFQKYNLERIIKNDLDFLRCEYKKTEETIISELNNCEYNIKKLKDKEKNCSIKLDNMEKSKNKYIRNISNIKSDVSLKDKIYLNLTEKSNKLIVDKNILNNKYKRRINENEKVNHSMNEQILNKNKEINILQEKKKFLEEKMAKKNKIILLEIGKLKSLISEKFNIIKFIIDDYRKKNGNSFYLYDMFIDKISKNLISTSKSLIHKHNTSHNIYYKTPKNRPYLELFKQEKEDYSNYQKFLTVEKRNYSRDFIKNNNKNNILRENNLKTLHEKASKNIYENIIDNIEVSQNKIKNKPYKEYQKSKTLSKISKNSDLKVENIIDKKYGELKIKYNELTKPYKCYFREYLSNKDIIFDPLCHSGIILEKPFKFKSGFIKLLFKKNHIFLIIQLDNRSIFKEINIKDIQATIVNNNLKYIIKIHQRYRHRLDKDKYFDINKFIVSKELEDIPLDYNKKKLAINNKYFNFSIVINNKESSTKRIEFILEKYESIKSWINALNYLIKLK